MCHTRNISVDGCFLDTRAVFEPGASIQFTVLDNRIDEQVPLQGVVIRASQSEGVGVGVRLKKPPPEWLRMVEQYRKRSDTDLALEGNIRLMVLVAGTEDHRRAALALYVKTGWDVRFAADVKSAIEALKEDAFDAIVVEYHVLTHRTELLEAAKALRPTTLRIVRIDSHKEKKPATGQHSLVQKVVELDEGLDGLVAVLDNATDDWTGA